MSTVAISYAHSPQHENKLDSLVKKLEKNGIKVIYDQTNLKPGADLPLFMENLTLSDEIDYILVICEKNYRYKADHNINSGVRYEARNLRYLINNGQTEKVIPIVFEHDQTGAILPKFLRPSTYIDLSQDPDCSSSEFDKLLNYLQTNQVEAQNIDNSVKSNNKFGFSSLNNICLYRKKNIASRSTQIVKKITQDFYDHQKEDVANVDSTCIYGWNGEGKTTILIEIGYQLGVQFEATILLDTNLSILGQYLSFSPEGEILRHKLPDIQFKEFKNYINSHAVLLLFDNVQNIADIEQYFPQSGLSRVIMATTNRALTGLESIEWIELPELSEDDATDILMQGVTYTQTDSDIISSIVNLYDSSPFGLELANSYIKSHPDLDLKIIYQDLKSQTVQVCRNNKYTSRIIHSSPSIIALLKNKIEELDTDDRIDRLCIRLITYVGILHLAQAELSYRTLTDLIQIDTTTSDGKRDFSEIKLRLMELGLVAINNNSFSVHTFLREYSKEILGGRQCIMHTLEYYRNSLLSTLSLQREFRSWCDNRVQMNSYKLLFEYYIHKYPVRNLSEGESLLPHIYALYDGYYFSGNFSKADRLCDQAIKLSSTIFLPQISLNCCTLRHTKRLWLHIN